MMEKDCECIYLEDNKDYFILDSINYKDKTFVYLSNTEDSKDICIRKK